MTERAAVATGLATALLGGVWTEPAMTRRTAHALGTRPPWLRPLVREVLALYRDIPADRPRELAAVLTTTAAWVEAWTPVDGWVRPRIVALAPTPTRMAPTRWPVVGLPDLGALAALLDLDQGELAWFADVRGWERRAAPRLRHYRWTILERPGSLRLLAAPKPRLKEIQRRLLRHVLAPIAVHDASHGGVPGRSVRTALEPHGNRATVLRFDLEAFFASIPAPRIWGILRTAGYPEAVAHLITGLVTTVVPLAVWQTVPDADRQFAHGRALATPHLPQGAPTSPALANLVTFSLDRRLTGLARRFDATYTRYVDDLTFSGASSLYGARSAFVAAVDRIVRAEGFRLNERKTVALRSSGRQQALGAVLNDRPTLPRAERDNLRALLHNCATNGWASQTRGRSRTELREHVLGRVAWASGLDPRFGARLRPMVEAIDWS